MAHPQGLSALLLGSAAADLLDEDGRPLGELASLRYDEVATEVVACPWGGSRAGRPMNRSALRQITPCWSEVVAAVGWLAGEAPTVHHAWAAVQLALAAPAIRHQQVPDLPIPRLLSALYKTSLGFTQVLTTVLLAQDGVADQPLAGVGDGPGFLDFLELGRWLVGHEQVCAGPPPRIRELYEALARGTPDAEPPAAILNLHLGDHRDVVLTTVGLQAAAVVAGSQALRRGEDLDESLVGGWLKRARSPTVRAFLGVPEPRPEHVRRLFPEGRTPAAVEEVLQVRAPLAGISEAVQACLPDRARGGVRLHPTGAARTVTRRG